MKELLIKLNQLTDVTLYVCNLREQQMNTVHDGAVFEAETPSWMQSFVLGDKMLLVFEQRGQRKQYFRWKIDDNTQVVILDDSQHNTINLILNKMLNNLEASGRNPGLMPPDPLATDNSKMFQEKLTQTIAMLEDERKARIQEKEVFAGLENQVKLLKEQNIDQANRLKDTLAKNLEFSHQLKQIQVEAQTGISRNNATLLKEENTRLIAQIQDLEERFDKLSSKYNDIVKNPPEPSIPVDYNAQQMHIQPPQQMQPQQMMPQFYPQMPQGYQPDQFQQQFFQPPETAYPQQEQSFPPQDFQSYGQPYQPVQLEDSSQMYTQPLIQNLPPPQNMQPQNAKIEQMQPYMPQSMPMPPVQNLPQGALVSAQPSPQAIDLNFDMPSQARQMNMQNQPNQSQAQIVEREVANPGRGLMDIITALNNVIIKSDASHIDLEKLSKFLPIPPKAELERNPSAIKAIIAKLSGLERTGQLTPAQIKKLGEIILK